MPQGADGGAVSGFACFSVSHAALAIEGFLLLCLFRSMTVSAGVEDRTPLIFFVGEAPSPDDNPGMERVAGNGPASSVWKKTWRKRTASAFQERSTNGIGEFGRSTP